MDAVLKFTAREWAFVVVGLIALIVLFPLVRSLIWRLFRFENRVDNLLSQAKSSEVRTGKLVETLAPLLDDFPVDIRKPGTSTVFIGQPIDFVHFDPEEGVTFIEVKSGGAQLSPSQRAIRECIANGAVQWREYRVQGQRPTKTLRKLSRRGHS